MNDLIRRQAVLDYPIRLDHYDEEHGNRHFVLGIESVMEYVEYLPSADAVEVVRCKDCVYSEAIIMTGLVYCNEIKTACSEEGYCYIGERRGW